MNLELMRSGRLSGRTRWILAALAVAASLAVGMVAFVGAAGAPVHPPRRSSLAASRLGVRGGRHTAVRTRAPADARATRTASPVVTARPKGPPPLVVRVPRTVGGAWTAVAIVDGQPTAWLAQRAGVTYMRFDQTYVHLDLHAGSQDGGVEGWIYGDQVSRREIHSLVAGFNGGFKLSYKDVGFASGGHVAAGLKDGLASIVNYSDGTTDIGAWHEGVPRSGKRVFSVLQNQRLLVDRGEPSTSAAGCIIACWGETIGGRTLVARSGLGITAGGQLVWAAGEKLLPAMLARALLAAGAVRALELDINPDWVAGYLYPHHPSGPEPVPLVPGQIGISGQLLAPDTRDFLTVVANRRP